MFRAEKSNYYEFTQTEYRKVHHQQIWLSEAEMHGEDSSFLELLIS